MSVGKIELDTCGACGGSLYDYRNWDLGGAPVFASMVHVGQMYPDEMDVLELGVRVARHTAQEEADCFPSFWVGFMRRQP